MILPADLPYLRWVLLKLLASQGGGYWAADGSLARGLDAIGFGASMPQVRVGLFWLADVNAAEIKTAGENVSARLTQAGLDVVEGRQVIPGIKKPLHLDLEE
ncbi:VpaChn25_0724 family phage protein [Tepidicaulis sp. LMO-SS28]|uniref:VpaChn25_0724 family phage protein n=1 Tax=Tepidicaulis sp. LMO-SS28 TaxID=3447455 RepID=UPI003EDF4D5B